MLFFFFFTFKENTFCPTPSQQNNLTGVFSTASKTRSQLILTWSQQFISVIMSCSHCKTGFARLALSRPPPGASGGGFLRQGHRSRDSSGARRPDGGDGGRRGAGSTGTLEQAVRGREVPAGSLGWWRAAGGLCRVCREVRKSLSPGPGHLIALRAGALLSAEASFLLSALQALSSALPASLREDRETGLGEVERFIPGEQAGEKGGAVRADVTAPHPGVPWSSRGWTQGPSAWGQLLPGRSSPPRIQRPLGRCVKVWAGPVLTIHLRGVGGGCVCVCVAAEGCVCVCRRGVCVGGVCVCVSEGCVCLCVWRRRGVCVCARNQTPFLESWWKTTRSSALRIQKARTF